MVRLVPWKSFATELHPQEGYEKNFRGSIPCIENLTRQNRQKVPLDRISPLFRLSLSKTNLIFFYQGLGWQKFFGR